MGFLSKVLIAGATILALGLFFDGKGDDGHSDSSGSYPYTKQNYQDHQRSGPPSHTSYQGTPTKSIPQRPSSGSRHKRDHPDENEAPCEAWQRQSVKVSGRQIAQHQGLPQSPHAVRPPPSDPTTSRYESPKQTCAIPGLQYRDSWGGGLGSDSTPVVQCCIPPTSYSSGDSVPRRPRRVLRERNVEQPRDQALNTAPDRTVHFSSSPIFAEEDEYESYSDGWGETDAEATVDELLHQKLVFRRRTIASISGTSHSAIKNSSSLSRATSEFVTFDIPVTRHYHEQPSAFKSDLVRLESQPEHEEPITEETISPDDSEDPGWLRDRARTEHSKMTACFRKHDHANRMHDRVRSRYWSKMGRKHEKQRNKLKSRASDLIFEANNKGRRPGTIDLHRLYVNEAIERTNKAISEAKLRGDAVLRLIVGKGLHSDGKASRIGPALKKEMQRQSLRTEVDTRNPGILIVHLS